MAVGNSLGGQLAVNLAVREPERVAGLVLTGSSGVGEQRLGTNIRRRPDRQWLRERVREIFYDARHVTDRQVDDVMSIFYDRREGLEALMLARRVRSESVRDALRQVHCPVSLIWGAEDKITPPETAREFQELLPDAELHFIPRCGHAPMMEQPREFHRIVANFLRRLAGKDAAVAA